MNATVIGWEQLGAGKKLHAFQGQEPHPVCGDRTMVRMVSDAYPRTTYVGPMPPPPSMICSGCKKWEFENDPRVTDGRSHEKQLIIVAIGREANRVFQKAEKDYPSNILDRVARNLAAGRYDLLTEPSRWMNATVIGWEQLGAWKKLHAFQGQEPHPVCGDRTMVRMVSDAYPRTTYVRTGKARCAPPSPCSPRGRCRSCSTRAGQCAARSDRPTRSTPDSSARSTPSTRPRCSSKEDPMSENRSASPATRQLGTLATGKHVEHPEKAFAAWLDGWIAVETLRQLDLLPRTVDPRALSAKVRQDATAAIALQIERTSRP